MSYRNPQQVIDNRNSIVTQGITTMLDASIKDIRAYRASEKKKQDKAAEILAREKQAGIDRLNKTKTGARASLETQYSKAKSAADKFTSGLTSEGKKTSDAVRLDEQVQGVLTTIGRNLNDELSNPDLTLEQISRLKQDAINKMNNFTQDMMNWELARQEYFLAKSKGPDEVGALLTDPELQRNPELIRMFEAMMDDNDDDLYITIDEETGSTRISSGKIKDGNFEGTETKDLTAWTRDHKDGPRGSYFETTEAFDGGNYKKMGRIFGDLKNDKRFQKNGKLDKEELKKYLKTDPEGKNFASSFMTDSKNKWVSLIGDVNATYSDDAYIDTIVDRSWNLYAPKYPKQKPVTTEETVTVEETGDNTGNLVMVDQTETETATPDFGAAVNIIP